MENFWLGPNLDDNIIAIPIATTEDFKAPFKKLAICDTEYEIVVFLISPLAMLQWQE